MRNLTAGVLLSVLFIYSGCKKSTQPFKVNVIENNVDKVYGSFEIATTFNNNLNPTFFPNYFFYVHFTKSPQTELTDYPTLSSATINNSSMLEKYDRSQGILSWIGGEADWTSTLNSFLKFRFSFNSPELGNCSYIESDTIEPYFNFQYQDTVRFSKTSVNSFTINNYPGNFTLSARLEGNFQGLYSLEKKLYRGNNVVKFYPEEVSGLTTVNTFILEFSQKKEIRLNGRRFELTRSYQHQYVVVWTP